MVYRVELVDVWSGEIADEPGSLCKKLLPLNNSGINLEFLLARRDKSGRALVFIAPIKGVAHARVAKANGLKKDVKLAALRVSGPDKKGLGTEITDALGSAGINLRGISAMAVEKNSVFWLAFDGRKDAIKGRQVLRRTFNR